MSNIRDPHQPRIIRMSKQPVIHTNDPTDVLEVKRGHFFDADGNRFDVPESLTRDCSRISVQKSQGRWVWMGYPIGKMH